MGTYNYVLTTKSRDFVIDGQKQPVHLSKFAYKDSSRGMPRHVSATVGRLENLWGNASPKYVVQGDDFLEDYPVFTGWAKGAICVGDGYTESLPLIGFVRGSGRSRYIEQWHGFKFASPDGADRWGQSRHQTAAALRDSGLIEGKCLVRVIPSHDGYYVYVHAQQENDIVRAKMVLAQADTVILAA